MDKTSLLQRMVHQLGKGEMLSSLRRRLAWRLRSRHVRFLDGARGVIHVGANVGQERHAYALCGLPVVWVEPAPATFARLSENLAAFPAQRALQALVTDADGAWYDFHIANNGGGSSSIHHLNMHREVWPNVAFTGSLRLQGTTLPSLLEREGIDPARYDVLVMDTQGSELLVLRGAEPMLGGFRYIRTEASDFDAYSGGCQLQDLRDFLVQRGYVEVHRQAFASHPGGGHYYDVLFHRAGESRPRSR
jgi:FkbM family methyltransferase